MTMWREGSKQEWWHQSGHMGKNGPHPRATQLSFFLCISNTPQVCLDFLVSLTRKTAPWSQYRVGLVYLLRLMPY